MFNLRKSGGVAALVLAATYIVGFLLFAVVIDGSGYQGPDGKVRFLADNLQIMNFTMLLLYIVSGIAMVVLGLALHDRLRSHAGPGLQVASAFAIIWATILLASGMIALTGIAYVAQLATTEPEMAATVWASVSVVQDALGGGSELVGGLWMVLISAFAMTARQLPRALHILGTIIGIAGFLSILPPLSELVNVFGLGQIVWFAWIGVVLLRDFSTSEAICRELDRQPGDFLDFEQQGET
jgi:hypothetical protein